MNCQIELDWTKSLFMFFVIYIKIYMLTEKFCLALDGSTGDIDLSEFDGGLGNRVPAHLEFS